MKYGILFALLAALLTTAALIHGGWQLILLWPAVSFAVVALGYWTLGPRVFGKSEVGRLSWTHQAVLLPYLMYLWSVWHLLRWIKTERAYDRLSAKILIGRRLLRGETPDAIDHVIDLTCEFNNLCAFGNASYHCFAVLDGVAPTGDTLLTWVDQAASLPGVLYIHCAEGHGRTGLFAAALLLRDGRAASAEEALTIVQSRRPLIRLGRRQRLVLQEFAELLPTAR